MTTIQTFQKSTFKVQCVCISGETRFRGKDVATVLGYADIKEAITKNVDDDD
jgi:prophage antirepressor-like protein